MLLVIFGAGASYDSAPSCRPGQHSGVEYRPPLANQLFEERENFAVALTRFKRCQPIVPDLRHLAPDQNLEQVLERLRAQAEHYAEARRQLLAVQWYLQFTLWDIDNNWETVHRGVTNYKTLLNQIEPLRKRGQRVCLVTFNYDRMLDSAMPTVGVKIAELKDYVANEAYKVIKVHGSVNWARLVESPFTMTPGDDPYQRIEKLIDNAPDLKIRQSFQYIHSHPTSQVTVTPYIPALAIPVETKTDSNFECPQEHLEALRAFLPEVKKI